MKSGRWLPAIPIVVFLLGVVAFLGMGVWIERQFSAAHCLNVAAGWPLLLAIPLLVVWSGFWSYWQHRFHHTALMWPPPSSSWNFASWSMYPTWPPI